MVNRSESKEHLSCVNCNDDKIALVDREKTKNDRVWLYWETLNHEPNPVSKKIIRLIINHPFRSVDVVL